MVHRNPQELNDNKNLVSILQWIAFARRPLTPWDLYFAVRSGDSDFHISQVWSPNGVDLETMKLFILNCSKGLAELTTLTSDHGTITVQFIHESVRNFLRETGFEVLTLRRDRLLLGSAHSHLQHCCSRWVTTDLLEHMQARPIDAAPVPLLRYVIEHMTDHMTLAYTNGVPQEDCLKHFPLEVWTALARFFRRWYFPRQQHEPPVSLTEVLILHGATVLLEIELRLTGCRLLSYQYESALRNAISQDALKTVELLLDQGAPSDKSVEQQTETLVCAVERGNIAALELLFQRRKQTVPLQYYATVLAKAADEAEDLVKVVLDNIEIPMKSNPEIDSAIESKFL